MSRSLPRIGACDRFRSLDVSSPIPDDLGRFDAIVHAAGLVRPWAHPDDYERHNVLATANMLDFARRVDVPHFVFISSSSVLYCDGDQLDMSETTPTPPTPINAYAATKLRAERLVTESGLETTILRPRAVFGVGDTVLFPRILRAARLGLLPRLSRPDGGTVVGDLVSIDNLVRFVQSALERSAGGVFNLTDGAPVGVYQMIESVLEPLSLPPPRLSLSAPFAMKIAAMLEALSANCFGWREPPLTRFAVSVLSESKTFNIAKARAKLGPPIVPTAEALAHFIEWQKARQ